MVEVSGEEEFSIGFLEERNVCILFEKEGSNLVEILGDAVSPENWRLERGFAPAVHNIES